METYESLRKSGNGVTIRVRELVAETDHDIPVFIDESPQGVLHGLTWINKARRFYEGRKEDEAAIIPELDRRNEEIGERLGPNPRNDTYTLSHLLPWMQYHQQQGVQHLYIVDQENDLQVDNLPLSSPFITYVRAPYAFMDYYADVCEVGTNAIIKRQRL